ncbi:MAG: glycosyltransferase [Pyrinomonadaceae bacterium]|nr:glycosyltransferase [Pyrinomonadaceae bacterium]
MKIESSTDGRSANDSPRTESSARRDDARIKVSIVIPVRDEEQSLPALVASLQAQTFPPAEVVIVDGGSKDETVAVGRRLTEHDKRFRIIEAGPATPGRGRNVGTAAARSEWIAYTDAGIRLEPTWLFHLVQAVERDPTVEVVYGNYEPVAKSRFERAAALTYPAPRRERPGGWMRAPFIASSLIRRDVWQRVGGFPDLRAAEDLMFMERVEANTSRIGWSPEATVWWQLQPTLARTFRKFVLYSKHNVWAARQRYWHYGIARQYAVAFVFTVLAVVHHPWWLALPAGGLAARALKTIWQHRDGRGLLWSLNPIQFVYVVVILLAVDLATFTGWAQALLSKPPATGDARNHAINRDHETSGARDDA